MGTAYYMSPDQATGSAIDGRSDLYAFGVVGFSLLSGRLPFDGPQVSAVLVARRNPLGSGRRRDRAIGNRTRSKRL